MAVKTKEKLIEAALSLFSEKGYSGTNLQEIADSCNIVKSAVYRHFSSKEELWNTMIDEMSKYYYEGFGSKRSIKKIPSSKNEFIEMTMNMVNFTINDERIIKIRKILSIEQYRDERVKKIASEHFLTGLQDMFEIIFKDMIENGAIKDYNPKILALSYVSPIASLIHLSDREPDKKEESIQEIRAFSEHFMDVYSVLNN